MIGEPSINIGMTDTSCKLTWQVFVADYPLLYIPHVVGFFFFFNLWCVTNLLLKVKTHYNIDLGTYIVSNSLIATNHYAWMFKAVRNGILFDHLILFSLYMAEYENSMTTYILSLFLSQTKIRHTCTVYFTCYMSHQKTM